MKRKDREDQTEKEQAQKKKMKNRERHGWRRGRRRIK
jgi:hypothetical protein